MKDLSVEELENNFDNFIFNIDDYIDSIQEKARAQGYNFNLTINSLDEVEEYIITNNINVQDDDFNDLSAYLGEFVVENFEGRWKCNLDKVNNSLYYGFPVIEGHSLSDVLFSPFHVIKAFILRKRKGLLKEAILSQVNPQKIDWTNYPTED